MPGAVIAVIAVLITLVVAVPITYSICHFQLSKRRWKPRLEVRKREPEKIIDDALKTAETKKREALLEAKEESLKTKNDLEKETRETQIRASAI